MAASAPVPKDDPRWTTWIAYKATDEYENTRKWAAHPQHVEGSLWAAFLSGFEAASLSHPAALERARAEGAEAGLERAARWHDEQAAALRALNETPLFKGRWRDLLVIAKQAIARHESNAKSIRALGPVPRPSPEAEPVDLSGGPPNDKLKTLYAEGRAMLATPPALAPEMRERLAKVLQWAGGLGNSIYSPEARALLFALSPQTDGGAK